MKYPSCTLATIITPGAYCVVSNEEEHLNEVKRVEECLAEEFQNAIPPNFKLKSQMSVAVQTPDGRIKRGVIERKLSSRCYEVLLIDYGQHLTVDKSKINIITNEAHLSVEPLSFIVKLYGVFPSEFCVVNRHRKARVTQNWQPQSEAYVKSLFVDSQDVTVQSILIKCRVVYGDIFVNVDQKKCVSLRKLLCKNEFCAYSESYFLKHEGLDLPAENSMEVTTKMEFVKKWQKENFEEFQYQTFPFSVCSFSQSSGSMIESPLKKDIDKSKTETSEPLPGPSQKSVTGRGKIKMLLSQMRNLQVKSSVDGDSNTLENHSAKSHVLGSNDEGKCSKKSETKKSSSFKSTPSESDTQMDDDGRFDDADHFMVDQKVDVVRPGECSPISDDKLAKGSALYVDSPPPLVRKNSVNFELVKQPKTLERTKMNTDSEKSENSEIPSREINILNLQDEKRLPGRLKSGLSDVDSSMKLALRNYWTPFVLFGDSVVEPVNTFRELPIQHSIIMNLEKGGAFNELSQIQRWAIPAIRKQHNTIVIGSSKTGKTLSYLVPLTDYVQDESYFEELPEGNGPTVVIVAASSRVCESIYYMCHSLLGNVLAKNICSSKIRVVLAHGNGCEKEIWVKLTNGCDILISTPHCLTRLLEYPVLTNFERLCCLVMDEVDVISQKNFRKQVRVVLEKAKLSTKNRHYQKILCGERWTPEVETLVKKYTETYALIIGSYLEAVIYEKLKPKIYLVLQDRKAETLLEKLKGKIGKAKILIVCESPSDAIFVGEFLTSRKISPSVAHENLMVGELQEIGKIWRADPQSVLVVTDGVLSEMKIREAQVLIHYGLPIVSKTNFFLRYSAFENFIRGTRRIQHVKDESHSSKLVDIILVNDEDHFQLPHIVDFVMRLGGTVSGKILQKCEEIRRVIEVSKTNMPICSNLLTFGRCRSSKSCLKRHSFVKFSDSPGKLPSSGCVNFSVLKVHDASSLSVRLTEHTDDNGKCSKLEDGFLEIPIRLAEVFKTEENRRPHGTPSLGDICAVKSAVLDQEVFYRAQVVEYLKWDKNKTPIEVSVKLLDEGDIWSRKNIELYELPKELCEYPPVAVTVKMVGLQPLDFDMSWSEIANAYVKDIMTQTLEENQYWSGKIVLALNGILFLDRIKRKQFLPHLNTHAFDLVLKKHLIVNRVAVSNEEHLPSLMKLCLEGGINVPRVEEVKKEDVVVIQPQWAFFDSDFVRVRFLSAIHTWRVFLQPVKFEKLLCELEVDCQREGERITKEMLTKKSATFNFGVGAFCLAKYEDGKWNRGRIDDVTESDFYVFFVDHGDFLSVPKSDVVAISQSLLLRLPCQAIECSLIGVHREADPPIEVLYDIYEFSEDGKLDLYALIIEKSKSKLTSGWKYSLNLVSEKGVSLNKSLVLSGKVPAEESERGHLKDVEIYCEEEKDALDDESEQEVVEEATKENFFIKYLEGLEDDVFNNAEGWAFIEKFMQHASYKYPLKDTTPEQNQLPLVTEGSETVEASQKAHDLPENAQIINQSVKEPSRKERSNRKENLILIKHDKVLTPQVLWSQDHSEVRMKIILENVRDHILQCTATNLAFRCFVGEKLYAFDLKLYGAINPQRTRLILKAFHVVVILTKLVSPLWPRLHRDKGKHCWVNLDVESLADEDDDFVDRIRTVKHDMEEGVLKKGVDDSDVRPCSDSEDGENELDSESESV